MQKDMTKVLLIGILAGAIPFGLGFISGYNLGKRTAEQKIEEGRVRVGPWVDIETK